MIIEFILSLITVFAVSVFCVIVSGGSLPIIFYPVLLAEIIGILAVFIFLSGYGKDFCKIFLSRKKFKAFSLEQLKKCEYVVSFAQKSLVYICTFFAIIGAIYFYINFDYIQTLGVNLSTVLMSLIYLCQFEIVLFILNSKIKAQKITVMAEDSQIFSQAEKLSSKQIILKCVKIIISLAVIVGLSILVILGNTKNESEKLPANFVRFFDIPSIVYLLVMLLPSLVLSGNFKTFFRGFKIAFKNRKITVSEKSLCINAIQTARYILLLTGFVCTLIGFMAILCNLQTRELLGLNMYVATIVSIYAIILNVILLPLESKINKLV